MSTGKCTQNCRPNHIHQYFNSSIVQSIAKYERLNILRSQLHYTRHQQGTTRNIQGFKVEKVDDNVEEMTGKEV